MLMLEHHAKLLLAEHGLPVPEGIALAGADAGPPPFPAPWVVKAQVPVGGRGKAGFIALAQGEDELRGALRRMLGATMKGHAVRECRVERAVADGQEAYVSFSIDAKRALVNVLVSAEGGVDVERKAHAIRTGAAAPDEAALAAEIDRLTAALPQAIAPAVRAAALALSRVFLARDLMLLEINPLFVRADGSWMIGDAKVITDDNALARQPRLRQLVEGEAATYPDVAFKLAHGFDFVILDPEGEIGLVTTGAGLSMKLVDEMAAKGVSAFNFCDIRSGQMRGDPARLIYALHRMAAAPRIRAVLVNIFAGITNLAEFADLLMRALDAVPELTAPLVIRLVGNGEARATAMLGALDGHAFVLEPDLDRALAIAAGVAPRKAEQFA